MFAALRRWFRQYLTPLKDQVSVAYDLTEVRVVAGANADQQWNQSFAWTSIRRVCFKDGGMFASDVVYISLREPDRVVVVPTMAKGGSEFFGALCDRGLFPIWREAVAESGGGMHCWPPPDKDV